MVTERIKGLLEACEGGDPRFPPAVLFNEGWLLRLVLDWFAGHEAEGHPFRPAPGAGWFSEAGLPSAFLARYRGDDLGESHTHADGVVGHIRVGEQGAADLELAAEARQLVVIEAKLFSRLSAGVKNAPYYDQAARTVACVAEVLRRARRRPERLETLAFYVVAPEFRIAEGAFLDEVESGSIRRKVRRRAEAYIGARDDWFRAWFAPTIDRITLKCLAWESLVETIAEGDARSGQMIDSFYGRCLRFNRRRGPASRSDRLLARLALERPAPWDS